jgi:hypothetical protein
MSALWRVSLMLLLNRSLLNREYILINILKALASLVARTPRKTPSSVVQSTRLPVRYLAIYEYILLLLSACVAGMCLPTHCLVMGIVVHISIFTCAPLSPLRWALDSLRQKLCLECCRSVAWSRGEDDCGNLNVLSLRGAETCPKDNRPTSFTAI